MADKVSYKATGKRKNAIAKVELVPGEGKFTVNGKGFKEYFPRETLRFIITEPLKLTGTDSAYDVIAKIKGGGVAGQADALKHGISKSLLEINGEYRPILKKAGLITRDPREKERKKYGLKKARKRPQFSKR